MYNLIRILSSIIIPINDYFCVYLSHFVIVLHGRGELHHCLAFRCCRRNFVSLKKKKKPFCYRSPQERRRKLTEITSKKVVWSFSLKKRGALIVMYQHRADEYVIKGVRGIIIQSSFSLSTYHLHHQFLQNVLLHGLKLMDTCTYSPIWLFFLQI